MYNTNTQLSSPLPTIFVLNNLLDIDRTVPLSLSLSLSIYIYIFIYLSLLYFLQYYYMNLEV